MIDLDGTAAIHVDHRSARRVIGIESLEIATIRKFEMMQSKLSTVVPEFDSSGLCKEAIRECPGGTTSPSNVSNVLARLVLQMFIYLSLFTAFCRLYVTRPTMSLMSEQRIRLDSDL